MAFPLDEIRLGPHAYGQRKGTEAVVLHTTEYPGITQQDALNCIRDQSPGGSLYAGGGSYHWIIYDGGLILSVPYLESAGSLMGNHNAPEWKPKDHVIQRLSSAAQADTNAYVVAVSFSVRAADLAFGVTNGRSWAIRMIDTAARLIRWIEQQSWAPDDINVFGHSDFQSNRSDPGAGVVDAVITRYASLFPVATSPTAPAPSPAITDWAGRENVFGTRYPSYVHTDAQALAWVNRRLSGASPHIRDLIRNGTIKLG